MLPLTKHLSKDGFRLRGAEMSRLDGFSDVVFGFTVTLLVVSLEVPKSYAELHSLLIDFLPFAVSFLLLMILWHAHFKFFRRYGLEDAGTIALNGVLLFLVLFYVYPLKFIFQAMFRQNAVITAPHDVRELTLLYCGGFAAIYALFAALYANAWRQRDELELNALERRLTRLYLWDEGALCVIGVLACVIALVLPGQSASWAPISFMLIGVSKSVIGRKIGRAKLDQPVAAPAGSMNS
jgi:uncharacterized membrane protein